MAGQKTLLVTEAAEQDGKLKGVKAMGKLVATAIVGGALIAGAAACGSSAQVKPAAPPQPSPTVEQVAKKVGADIVSYPTQRTMLTKAEAVAYINGKPVDIAVFKSDNLRDRWLEAASGIGSVVSMGHDYAVVQLPHY